MGRDWTRRSIEELVDDTVRQMIKDGEIEPPDPGDHGGVLPDIGQPYNIPYYFYCPNFHSSHSVRSLGFIERCIFHPSVGGWANSNSSETNTERVAPRLNTGNTNPPIISSFNGATANVTPSALAYQGEQGYCANLYGPNLRYDTNRDFLIMANSSSGSNTFYWFDNNIITGHSASTICSLPYSKTSSFGQVLSTDHKALKATMMFGGPNPNTSQILEYVTQITVYDNPPPFYFISLPSGANQQNTIGGFSYHTESSLTLHLSLAVILKNANQIDALETFFTSGLPSTLNLYTITMTDDNIKKLVNPRNPNAVTVTHVDLGW